MSAENVSSSAPSQVSDPVPDPVTTQAPAPVPAQAPSLPKHFSHNSSFIVPRGMVLVVWALHRYGIRHEISGSFKLTFSACAEGENFDVVVKQYLRADGQTIIVFNRVSNGTVGFNMLLRGYLLESMRPYGIATLAGDVVPRAYYPTLQ